ncbi:hypothetical protein ACE6H2_001997 [Prunus campanulata]
MEFSKTYLFVLLTTLLLLSSSCFGDQGSANNDLKTLVSSFVPYPIKQSTKFADQHPFLKYGIKMQVPSGPNPLHNILPPKVDGAKNYHILREVPSGSNPLHHNVPPQKKLDDDPANHQILREVPSGSNLLHHNVPLQKKFNDPANFHPTRLMPTGPNRAEFPEEPPSKVLSGPPPSPSPAKANPLKPHTRRLLGIPI